MVPEFDGFEDRLTSFQLLKGKNTGNPITDEKNKVGTFKVKKKSAIISHNRKSINE